VAITGQKRLLSARDRTIIIRSLASSHGLLSTASRLFAARAMALLISAFTALPRVVQRVLRACAKRSSKSSRSWFKDANLDRKIAMTKGVPLGRLGRTEDIAQAIVFLASSNADFLTGEIVHVNGEKTAL
jgi:NAD(P)-dependent dehydrogenase (short-subunit alcohol dehydrogenase family)